MPTTLIDEIVKKEALFSEYSSAELLEIIVSYLEYNDLDSSHFATSFAPQGTFRRGKESNNSRPKLTQERNVNWQKPTDKRVKQI